jgi:hypothetical protein
MVAIASTALPSAPSLPAFEPIRPRFGPRPGVGRHRPMVPDPATGPLLPAEPAVFGWLGRRFAPGEATLFVGPAHAVEPLLEFLYVGCVRAGGRVSLLEGSNRFHPYRVGERARSLGLDPGEALEQIRLARAFTGYQMASLVDGWGREVRRSRPTLLVAHDVPAMFFSSDFPAEERTPLLRHVAESLADVVPTTRRPMLVTAPGGLDGFPGLAELGPRLFDLVRVTPGEGGLALEAYREAARLALVHRPDGQRGLEEFQDVQEVTRWDGRPRRTDKRWTSG